MFGGTLSPTSRKPSSDPMIPKDYKGSSEQCFPLEAAVPASSKEPKNTNPPSAKPTQSPVLLWHFPETLSLLLNTSLISTDSRCPWWENNQTWVRVLSSQMQYPSIMIWTPPGPHNSISVVEAWEGSHQLPSTHPIQARQFLSTSQLPHWLQRTSWEPYLLRCLLRSGWEDGKKRSL